jgi:hypothetical protein
MKLTRTQSHNVKRVISKLFDNARARLMGRHFNGPFMLFGVSGYDPKDSLEGLYRHAGISAHVQFNPNHDTAESLAEVAGNYLEAEKLKTIARVMSGVERAATKTEAAKTLREALNTSKKYVELVVDDQLGRAQHVADREGIAAVAASIGISDPAVVFLGRFDDRTCEYCRKMYHDASNPAIPRVYRLSEVSGGLFKGKEWDGETPYFSPIHPRCRHKMTFLPNGYGFDKTGGIEFKGLDYDAITERGKLSKAEMFLERCSCDLTGSTRKWA